MRDVGVAGVPGIVFGPSESESDWAGRIRLSARRADEAVYKAAGNFRKFWKK